MFEYDYNGVSGEEGAKVWLCPNGTLQLEEGEMYHYRRSVDVHSQCPPTAASITINVMMAIEPFKHHRQYIMDVEEEKIVTAIGGFFMNKFLFDMAALVGNEETRVLLNEIEKGTNCDLTRQYLKENRGECSAATRSPSVKPMAELDVQVVDDAEDSRREEVFRI